MRILITGGGRLAPSSWYTPRRSPTWRAPNASATPAGVSTCSVPAAWPRPAYATGFTDVRTSQAYVDELAPAPARAVRLAPCIVERGIGTLHVAGPPTTVFELARRRKPDVVAASKVEAGVDLPDDVVHGTSLWDRLEREVS